MKVALFKLHSCIAEAFCSMPNPTWPGALTVILSPPRDVVLV
jgi:hypothetical protein